MFNIKLHFLFKEKKTYLIRRERVEVQLPDVAHYVLKAKILHLIKVDIHLMLTLTYNAATARRVLCVLLLHQRLLFSLVHQLPHTAS